MTETAINAVKFKAAFDIIISVKCDLNTGPMLKGSRVGLCFDRAVETDALLICETRWWCGFFKILFLGPKVHLPVALRK